MAEASGLFLADAESGGTGAFDSLTQEGSNTFAASASAALHGSYGYRLTFDGTNNDCYGVRAFTARTETYIRCYLRFDSSFAGDAGTILPLVLRSGTSSYVYARFVIASGNISIDRFYYRTDSATTYASVTQSVSKGSAHYVEMHYKSATGAGANDGVAELWFDGTRIGNVTGIDSDTVTLNGARFGLNGTNIPTNGSILDIDDCKIDSSAIGAYADQTITGTAALTQATQSLAASGFVTIVGTSALSQASQSLSASGSVGSGETSGTAELIQSPQSLSASGTTGYTITGVGALSQAPQGLAAAGFQNPSATIINHTYVEKYSDIPSSYKSAVKSMWLSVPGESHSLAYRTGLELLEAADASFAVSVIDTGTPEAQTSDNLRASRASWGDVDHATGWRYGYGEEDWYTSAAAIAQTKAMLAYCKATGPALTALGFGWCWDMTWANGGYVAGLPNDLDPVYKCHWAGSSVGGPQGNWRWGLGAADSALTGNDVCLDTYLYATQDYINYCVANDIDTTVFFTTGPVDGNAASENGYQRELKQARIRAYVEAHGGWLFDYADILAWDDAGNHTTSSWTDGDGTPHTFDQIDPDNLGAADVGHIDAVGALRLGKALWVMLAMLAGWDGEPEGTVTGTAALTQAPQSMTASGSVAIVGSGDLAQSPQRLQAAGVVTITGTAALVQEPQEMTAYSVISTPPASRSVSVPIESRRAVVPSESRTVEV